MERLSRFFRSLLILLLLAPILPVWADTVVTAPLIVREVKVYNGSTAFPSFDEYIEFYNTTDAALNLNEFSYRYFKTIAPTIIERTATSPIVIGDGLLAAKASYVLAKQPSQITYSGALGATSLADTTDGLIEVSDKDGAVIDSLAWVKTSAQAVEPVVYLPPLPSGTSEAAGTARTTALSRNSDEAGSPLTTWQLVAAAPLSTALVTVPPVDPPEEPEDPGDPPIEEPTPEDPTTPPTETPTDPPAEPSVTLLPLQITELLPNPASPLTDDNDEFVELYNPNDTEVSLEDYKLQTGNSNTYSYIFDSETIAPRSYRAFFSRDSGLVLSNSSGKARLLNGDAAVVSETIVYDKADDDMAWALLDSWQWTGQPTPGAPNVFLSAEDAKLAAAAKKITGAKKAAVKKTTAKKATAAKKTAATKAAKTTKNTARAEFEEPQDIKAISPVHPAMLASIGGLALAYGGYEYRHDAANKIAKLRTNRRNRP